MSLNYQFNIDHAQKYGVNEAIAIQNFLFWIAKNKANGLHNYDGKTWTYNSVAAFGALWPFWTTRQIRTVLQSLLDQNVLVKGNYNAAKNDHTLWYAFAVEEDFIPLEAFEPDQKRLVKSDKSKKAVCHKGQNDLSEMTNGFAESDKSYKETDIKPVLKPVAKRPAQSAGGRASRIPEDWEPDLKVIEYAKKLKLQDWEIRAAASEFRDYWLSASGKTAMRVDWNLTFKSRLRDILVNPGLRAKLKFVLPAEAPEKVRQMSADEWESRLNHFDNGGRWNIREWGPQPGQPGYQGPTGGVSSSEHGASH